MASVHHCVVAVVRLYDVVIRPALPLLELQLQVPVEGLRPPHFPQVRRFGSVGVPVSRIQVERRRSDIKVYLSTVKVVSHRWVLVVRPK